MDAYWRAANYISVGQIYLQDNPLLETLLTLDHIKPRLLGTGERRRAEPSLRSTWNPADQRERPEHDLRVIGPGHGGPGIVAHTYLGFLHRSTIRDRAQPQRAVPPVPPVSWPHGIPATSRRRCPARFTRAASWVIHWPAYGAVRQPDLIVACVVGGDGEAETGALATSWHSNKFLNPARDGAVLPILHLSSCKIANPRCWRASATGNRPT